MFYKVNKQKLDSKDRNEIVDIIRDYLAKTYGDVASFNYEIVGELEKSSFEYRGKNEKQKT